MAQDTTPAIVIYQGTGSKTTFDVPFDKGYYGDVKVAFVRRGLADYTYEPDTYTVNGRLYAWAHGATYVYTHTAIPAVGAPTYDDEDVEQADTVSAVAGQTITVDGTVYTRAQQHDIENNLLLTWTGDMLEVGDYICIIRDTERGQPYELPNNQKHIEGALDNIERQVQENKNKLDNALLVDPSHATDSSKMNPLDWMKSIIRCMDFSVRALRYAGGWLDYSLDDPNIASADKTWVHLLNTDNIKNLYEVVTTDPDTNEEIRNLYYTDKDGTSHIIPLRASLNDITDVQITSPSNGNILRFDGTKWVNSPPDVTVDWGEITGDIEDQADLMDILIVKTDTMPTASADLEGSVYQYMGTTTSTYQHGYLYECKEISAGVYGWERIDVQPGGSRGRFLALWNCATGLAESNPPYSPYEYNTGDYFIVSAVDSTTNYKPDGTSYTTGTASTTVETNEVAVDDTYFFDGTNWKLQSNSNKTVTYSNIAGDIYDSTSAANALNAKQNTLTAGNNITINGTTISSDQVKYATYGTTTYADIVSWNSDDKIVLCEDSGIYYRLTYISAGLCRFGAINGTNYQTIQCTSSNVWTKSAGAIQTVNAAIKTGSSTPATDSNYYSALKTDELLNNTTPLSSLLVPDLDKRTPIASYEFDSSGATYKPLLRIPNNHSNPQDIPVLNAVFRITSTRTGVKTVCDCVLSSLRTTNGPLVLMRHHPGSTSSTTTGFDYVRTIYPKVLDNGYDWYFELRNPTNDSVHTKVDVYSSDTGITWIADGTISTFNSANQNQTAVALTTNNNLMWSITMPWIVSTANSAGYINSYLNKFVGGSLPVMGVAANGQSLVLLGTDKKFYPMSSTTVAIDPGFGAAVLGGAVASGTAVSWTNISSKRRTGTTEIPHNTLTIGDSCYLRCTMDASGNIYSNNYVDTQMSAGYTWLYIGHAENATTIKVNTEGSCFYTLDANGKLTHVNGKTIPVGLPNEATASNSLGIGYTSINSSYADSINIGSGALIGANNGLAIGNYATAEGADSIAIYSSTSTAHRAKTTHTGNIAIGYNALAINAPYTIAIGYNAFAQGTNAIQLGTGQNASSDTFQVWTYKLLDKTTGLIPTGRISAMTGATAGDDGTTGLVPAPSAGDQAKFLRGDGAWETPPVTTGANIDLSNLTATGANIANWSSNVTNCITNIPQDIKLELNNGTLTLKAGSKVYAPNGVGVFDTVTITNDLSITHSGNLGASFVYYRPATNDLIFSVVTDTDSGTTPPNDGTYYDTSTNLIHYYSGGVIQDTRSFPIAIVQRTGSISSIDQVFNGMGYIGKHYFRLPGLSGLSPDGRNADGTLKSKTWSLTEVKVNGAASGAGIWYIIAGSVGGIRNADMYTCYEGASKPTPSIQYAVWYDTLNNYIYYTNDTGTTWTQYDTTILATTMTDSSGVVTYFNVKKVYDALDKSDTGYIAHQAMPGKTMIALTLGASGSAYTAPVDGWFAVDKACSSGEYMNMQNSTNSYGVNNKNYNGGTIRLLLPVRRGETMYIYYDATGTTYGFNFIYAEGAI